MGFIEPTLVIVGLDIEHGISHDFAKKNGITPAILWRWIGHIMVL